MTIPVIIINFNRLTTLEKLVDQLLLLDYTSIYVLDMGSTYEPLLGYYSTCEHIKVIYAEGNKGHKYLWESGTLKNIFSMYPWVAVTDSDIELGPDTPKGFIEVMINTAKDYRIDKVGLAIAYKDIPLTYLRDIIAPIEQRYWLHRLPHPKLQVYGAPVDTTFCVVRPALPFTYSAVRIAGDYTCIHTDWYQDWNDLTAEQQYYMDTADVRVATTKQHYIRWKQVSI